MSVTSHKIDFRTLQNRVLEYTLRKGFIKELNELDASIKWDFILTLGIRHIIPRRELVNVDETILQERELFLNWYLFEREHTAGRTIGEIYLASPDFKKDFNVPSSDFREELRNLRKPFWGIFVVSGKEGGEEYFVRPLGSDGELCIHDRSTSKKVNVGDAFYAVLYSFQGRYYIGGKGILLIPKKTMRKYYKTEALIDLLEKRFSQFMKAKSGLAERTLREKEEMFSCLIDYVSEKGYAKLRRIEKLNVDTWMKWARRRYMYFSGTREDAYRRAFRQFHKHSLRGAHVA